MIILNKGDNLTFSEEKVYYYFYKNFRWDSKYHYDNYMRNVSNEGYSILFIPCSNFNKSSISDYCFENCETVLKQYYKYFNQNVNSIPQLNEKIIILAKNDYRIYEFMGVFQLISDNIYEKYKTYKIISTEYPIKSTFSNNLNRQSNILKNINSTNTKHTWTFEENKFCCDIFRDNYIIQKKNIDITKIIKQIIEKFPHLKSSSIRAKLQNIKQICFEYKIENSANINSLQNYSNQNFKAMIQSLNEKNIKINNK